MAAKKRITHVADSFAPRLQRYRSPFAFRGMCGDWDLSTSLQRLQHPLDTLRMVEHVMLRNFRKYAFHGLPTRLLDWTYSPFVAMHFATNELDKMDKDGVIWLVNFVTTSRFLPRPLARPLRERAAYSFNVEMLDESFPRISSVGGQKSNLARSSSFSSRRRLTHASSTSSDCSPFHEWLEQASALSEGLARKLIIPAKLKWELRDKLDQMNMTERVLMPGLDGLSAWLKRWYSPKSSHPVVAPTPPKRATRKSRPTRSRRSVHALPERSERDRRNRSGRAG